MKRVLAFKQNFRHFTLLSMEKTRFACSLAVVKMAQWADLIRFGRHPVFFIGKKFGHKQTWNVYRNKFIPKFPYGTRGGKQLSTWIFFSWKQSGCKTRWQFICDKRKNVVWALERTFLFQLYQRLYLRLYYYLTR